MTATPHSDLRCERVRLLLSLAIDDAATPEQGAEIDAHLPGCEGCRAARAADLAVRARCSEPVVVPTGLAERIAGAARRQRLEARAQNRFLVAAAVAAVLVAGVATAAFDSPRGGGSDALPSIARQSDAVRETAGQALRAGLAMGRSPLMNTPSSGAEDR